VYKEFNRKGSHTTGSGSSCFSTAAATATPGAAATPGFVDLFGHLLEHFSKSLSHGVVF
jgi:hypothetical protein